MQKTRQQERRTVSDRRAHPTAVTAPEALIRLDDELRNPLSVVIGYSDLLSEAVAHDARQIYFTGKVRAAAMKLLRVTDSIAGNGGLIDQLGATDRRQATRRAA